MHEIPTEARCVGERGARIGLAINIRRHRPHRSRGVVNDYGRPFAFAFAVVVTLAGCAPTAPSEPETPSVETSAVASASPSAGAEHFPTEAFTDISEDPVSEETAAEFQAVLDEMAGKRGMAATVMSPDGTWSGATGKADGVRDVRVDDQFAIHSVVKSVIAAQIMQMVEAGELDLDDPATDHLPADLDFDTNGATVRQLLGQRSGIPETNFDLEDPRLAAHPRRFWTPADALELVPPERAPVGESFEYANANYQLLGLVIEQIRGRPVADVLREGVLDVDGTDRLIYQPDEMPTGPMAMPSGHSTAALKKGGGYLPSLAAASADGAAGGALASDAPSLARWWRAFCAGEIVSQASLTEMATFHDGYGLGLYNVADPYAEAVGHTGGFIVGYAYVAWAGCLPEEQAIVVVLSNGPFDDIGGMARPLIEAVSQ
jgi:D-alanyl-D-alanine carboxypeptidase